MREQYIQTGEGFLIVYDITDKPSFEEAKKLHRQVLRVKGRRSFPVVIVANKCDLELQRQVSRSGMSSPPSRGCPEHAILRWARYCSAIRSLSRCNLCEERAQHTRSLRHPRSRDPKVQPGMQGYVVQAMRDAQISGVSSSNDTADRAPIRPFQKRGGISRTSLKRVAETQSV